jgi:gluconokinase
LPIVVMGVTGSGKTTVGVRLAAVLGGRFIDGDDLHTDAARAKMRAGVALTDDDRWPWLDRVGKTLAEASSGRPVIVACSALKRVYRDRLRGAVGPALIFVYLEAQIEAMKARVAARKNHYMPASLVDSQFATLEVPTGEPGVIAMPADGDVETEVAALSRRLAGAQAL